MQQTHARLQKTHTSRRGCRFLCAHTCTVNLTVTKPKQRQCPPAYFSITTAARQSDADRPPAMQGSRTRHLCVAWWWLARERKRETVRVFVSARAQSNPHAASRRRTGHGVLVGNEFTEPGGAAPHIFCCASSELGGERYGLAPCRAKGWTPERAYRSPDHHIA